MYSFGKRSKEQLDTIHPTLKLILHSAIKHFDFSVIEGQRTQLRQIELFSDGKSELDGVSRLSMHQHEPSLAVDIIPYEKGTNPFDGTIESELAFYKLHAIIMREAHKLGVDITWGGNWKNFKDLPHYQLA